MQLFGVAHKTALDLGYDQVSCEAVLNMLRAYRPKSNHEPEEPDSALSARVARNEGVDVLTTSCVLLTSLPSTVGDCIPSDAALSIQVNPQLSTIFDTAFYIFPDRVAEIAAGPFETSCKMPRMS